jgi:hypothetical protein
MSIDYKIPEPLLFNPLKHHLGYLRSFISINTEDNGSDIQGLTRILKHLGTSVMDVYTGALSIPAICEEIKGYLQKKALYDIKSFSEWAGFREDSYRIISLSDGSGWTLQYNDNSLRFIHFFPARNSRHSFRVKSNTLKSAIIYNILIGKNYITGDDLNKVRPLLGLSPVKDVVDAKAIREMIEILRD